MRSRVWHPTAIWIRHTKFLVITCHDRKKKSVIEFGSGLRKNLLAVCHRTHSNKDLGKQLEIFKKIAGAVKGHIKPKSKAKAKPKASPVSPTATA